MSKQVQEERNQSPGFWQIVLSTIAAAVGVQNRKNHEQDFKHGNIYVYIASGIIFTILFVLSMIFIVNLVLESNGL